MARSRRLLRWTANAIVTVLLVVAAAVVVIETDWFKNWLRVRLVAGAAGVLTGELRVGRLGGSLWTGVTLDDVQLLDANGEVLKADHIRVRYDPFQLINRRWVIDRVVIEGADVRVAQTAAGWNVMHLTRPRPPGNKATVHIRRLEIADSTVTIDPASNPARRLTNVVLDSTLTVTGGVLSMTFAKLRGYDEVTGLTLRELSGSTSDNFRAFDVLFSADSPTMRLGGVAHGEMDGTARVLTGTIDTKNVDFARLTGRPRFASSISGRVQARAIVPDGGRQSRVSFSFSGPRSTAFGYTADRIDATGEFAGGVVRFQSRVTGYDARATVNGVFRLPGRRTPATFTGRGTFAAVDLRRLPATLHLPKLDSRLSGQFDAAVDGDGWRAHAILSGGVVEGATIAEGMEGSVRVAGGLTSYGAVGTASHVNLQRFGQLVPVPALTAERFAGDLSGEFFVAGQSRADTPHLVLGGAALKDSTISETKVPALNALAWLADRRLLVSAQGEFEGLNALTLGLPDFPVSATGRADGWFEIADVDRPITEENIEGRAWVELGPSTLRDVEIASTRIDAQVLHGLLTLATAEVEHAGGSVRASGALGLREPLAAEGMTVAATIQDPKLLEQLLHQPVLAAGTVDAKISGTLQSPSATGVVTLNQTAYRDVATALTATTRFSVDWPERNIERLAWKVDADAAFVTIGQTEIQRLAGTAAGGLREMAVDVHAHQKSRSLGVEGRLTLRPDAQELLLRRLALTTENIAWSLPPEETALVRYGGRRINISDLTLVRGEQRIGVAGDFDLEPPGAGSTQAPAKLQLQIHEVELADLNQALLGTRQLTGRINGAVAIEGSRQAPIVDGDITIRDGVVQGVPYSSVQAKGRYAAGIATVDALLDQAPGASLRATGTIPTANADARAAMDLRVSGGPVNLGLVQAFTTEINNVSGTAAMDLRVTGSIRDPIVNGTATVTGGAFDVEGTGAKYKALEAALDFKDGQLAIRQLQAADETGDLLTATGGLDIRRGISDRAFDIQIKAHSFTVLNNAFGNAEVDADVRVSGDLAAPVVKGTVSLESGRLEVGTILERTTARPYSTEAQTAPGAEPAAATKAQSPVERANIDLQVLLPDNLVLRGRGLRVSSGGFGIGDMNIITGGSFDVTKRPAAPVDVRGSLEIVRGSYTFQGRRFEIERGSDVRFRSGELMDPTINLNATREVSGVTAAVRLRGSARAPELTLTSRPALDESDILSLIVFNQPVSSLGAAEQVNLGQRAAGLAAGAIASPLADSIGRALNLDIFEIQAPTSDDGTGSVLIGSQLGTRFLVGLRQQFGHSEASLLTLEYRVNKLLRFVTSIASSTLQAHATRRTDRGGVDLIFVIRY